MSRSRRRKAGAKPAAPPKKVIDIAAASSPEGPVLWALTEDGEIYEYSVVDDEERGISIGMWEGLSTIEPRNIVDADTVDDEDVE